MLMKDSRTNQLQTCSLQICFLVPVREAETKKDEIYEDLPLFEIEEKWGKSESGKKLVLISVKSLLI